MDRNNETENGDEPPLPPGATGEEDRPKHKGKAKSNTSKKKQKRRKKNRGKLILDATVVPADIKYLTNIDLLNKCREHLETAVGILWGKVPHTSHKFPLFSEESA